MKKFALLALLATVALFTRPALAQNSYDIVVWGGAISGSWNTQSVHLDAGSPFISGVLPASLVDLSGVTPFTGTTASIGGGLLLAGACTSGTVNVTNATTAMVAVASPVTYPGDGSDWKAYVSSSGVVTVKVCGLIALTPTATAFNVRVLQ